MTIATEALAFATRAHGAQQRKYTGEPYVEHPRRVAALLRSIGAPDHVLAAACLHDVLEDTPVNVVELLDTFGSEITVLVLEVTDVSRPGHGNRAARKAIDREHLSRASYWGQTIKLADMIDNAIDIDAHDPKFAKVYRAEMRALLEVMRSGDA